jgi:hypothetical protein
LLFAEWLYTMFAKVFLMTIQNNKISVLFLAIIISTGIVASTSLNLSVFAQNATQPDSTSVGPQNANFTASLSGQNEVPPTQSLASGTAEFSPSTDHVAFFMNATNIQNYTAAHIHLAPQGQNGPIVVTLVDFSAPTDQYSLNGNAFTAEDLEGPMQGKPLADLISEMNKGNTYVNIHTTQNPNGEIRGQIIPSNQ